MMNQQNQDNINSPPPAANELLAKRKRGRPRKDETVTPKPDTNLVGKVVTGVVEGSFDAGYFLNVKVKDSDIKLKGVVFLPGRVNPVTPETDVAPLAKMYGREEVKNNQPDQSLPTDQPMKDAAVTTDLEISEAARALSVMPQASNGDLAVQAKEARMEKDGVIEKAAATQLVEFFPTPETMMTTAEGQNLALVEKEKEQQKFPGEPRGFDLMAEEPVRQGEKVPEELQLELGKKTTLSGDNNNNSIAITETEPNTSASKSGFIANLFEGVDKKGDSNMEEEATPSVK